MNWHLGLENTSPLDAMHLWTVAKLTISLWYPLESTLLTVVTWHMCHEWEVKAHLYVNQSERTNNFNQVFIFIFHLTSLSLMSSTCRSIARIDWVASAVVAKPVLSIIYLLSDWPHYLSSIAGKIPNAHWTSHRVFKTCLTACKCLVLWW